MKKEKLLNSIDTYGEPVVGVVTELFLEGTLGAVVPGFTSIYTNLKQKRFEKNINLLMKELEFQIEDINIKFDNMSNSKIESFRNEFSELIIDYISEERDEEKIPFIVNGIKILMDENKQIENTSLYFDVLKDLRKIDILILKRFDYLSEDYGNNDLMEFIEEMNIDYDEYHFIKLKLLRLGLIESSYDSDQKDINEVLLELSKFLKELEKGKKIKLSTKLKNPKFKKQERIKLSKYGRSFINFFIEPSNNINLHNQ